MEKTLELICEALSNKKGVLIKILDVKDLTSIADYFIISSVMNKKQAQASADEERQHYDFDSLWKDAPSEDYSQNKNDK